MKNLVTESLTALDWPTPLKAFIDIATKRITEFVLLREDAGVNKLLKKQLPFWNCQECDTANTVRYSTCTSCGQTWNGEAAYNIKTSNWMFESFGSYVVFSTPLEHAGAVEAILEKKKVWYQRTDA